MARGNKPEEQENTTEQLNKPQASNDGAEQTAPTAPVDVVLLKNIRHTTGVHRKGEKLAVTPEESDRLISAKLARLPE